MKTKIIVTLFCYLLANYLLANSPTENNKQYVLSNINISSAMLSPQERITQKQKFLFHSLNEELQQNTLYIGTSIMAIADYQHSNTHSKFGYLMRHPTSNNQVGNDVSEVAIHSVQLYVAGNIAKYFTLYSELMYNPQQSFGGGTINSLTRNQVQVAKGYVLVGNPELSPFYFSLGKQDVPFGQMDSVNPFTASSTWHAFGVLANSAIFGVDYKGFNVSFSPIQGGAQFRAANTPVNGTSVPSKLNNFAADANLTYKFYNNNGMTFGASFLRGSAYNQGFPITHHSSGVIVNSAWSVYYKLNFHPFLLMAEFASTIDPWPGTHNPSAPLDVFPASKVHAFNVGGAVDLNRFLTSKPLKLSLEYSEFKAGPSGSPWHKQTQIVAGASLALSKNLSLFSETILISGYTPLNNISGDLNVAGTTHSTQSARTNVFLIGVKGAL